MRRGFAPTSRDFAHLAAANGFDPTTRWIWDVESIAVSSDICSISNSVKTYFSLVNKAGGGDSREKRFRRYSQIVIKLLKKQS